MYLLSFTADLLRRKTLNWNPEPVSKIISINIIFYYYRKFLCQTQIIYHLIILNKINDAMTKALLPLHLQMQMLKNKETYLIINKSQRKKEAVVAYYSERYNKFFLSSGTILHIIIKVSWRRQSLSNTDWEIERRIKHQSLKTFIYPI